MNYVLRTCDKNLQSHGGFQWPGKGKVTAPDWEPTEACGNGLHGFLNGEGAGYLADWKDKAKWLVCSVPGEIIDLKGKVKFKSCNVLFVGNRQEAIAFLKTKISAGHAIIGDTIIGGDDSTIIGGDYSTLTGGHRSTLTGGEYSTIIGGDDSTITGEDYATLTGGEYSTITGGYHSTLIGGYGSTITGEDYATLTGGEYSRIIGGDYSTLIGGYGSTLTGGDGSILEIFYHDGQRTRKAIAYVGENGIEAGQAYRLNEFNEFVKA